MTPTAAVLAALEDGPALVVDVAAEAGLGIGLAEACLRVLARDGLVEAFPNPAASHVTTWRRLNQTQPRSDP